MLWPWRLCEDILHIMAPRKESEMMTSRDQVFARAYAKSAYGQYRGGNLTQALRLCRRAYRLAPGDPGVAWDYACVLKDSGKEREAIGVFRKLLARTPERLVSIADGRDHTWVRSLRNDCRLMIGSCYFELHRSVLAEKWLRDYLRHLSSRTPSAYRKSIATRMLESIANHRIIDQLLNDGRLARASSLIRRELKQRPDDFYWLANLAFIQCEEGDCDSAVVTIRRALELAPREPLVMYYYAFTLRSSGRSREAIDVLHRIIRKGERRIGLIETKEGIRWARSLINDCRYEMALCFAAVKDFRSADRWLKLYIKGKRPGVPSSFDAKEVTALRRDLISAH
jgi:Flp pilus assembly protein TadD